MAVVVLCSAAGSPGVTSLSMGLALTWPRHVLLADCDRDPSQAVQAGYLRGMDHGGRGLMTLAQLHREGAPLAPELWRQSLPLTVDEATQRRCLPGFSTAGASRLFEHVWPTLGEAFESLEDRGVDVLVDAGRITSTGLPLGLVHSANAVIVAVRSSLRALAAARIHLVTITEQLAALPSPVPLALAVVGPRQPYGTAEIAAQFSLPVWAEVPWAPKLAAVLSDGADEPKRFHETGLMRRIRADAKALTERLHSVHGLVGTGRRA